MRSMPAAGLLFRVQLGGSRAPQGAGPAGMHYHFRVGDGSGGACAIQLQHRPLPTLHCCSGCCYPLLLLLRRMPPPLPPRHVRAGHRRHHNQQRAGGQGGCGGMPLGGGGVLMTCHRHTALRPCRAASAARHAPQRASPTRPLPQCGAPALHHVRTLLLHVTCRASLSPTPHIARHWLSWSM